MKNIKKIILIILIFTAVPALWSGGSQETPSGVQAEEDRGAREPRVISLGPNVTETIFALGRGDLLVGRTDYCNYPPEAEAVKSVGQIQQPNVETIIILKPDIVIGSTHASKEAADLLANAGIKVNYFYTPQSFEGVYDVIRQTAEAISAQDEAEKLISEIELRYRRLLSAGRGQNRPSVYYVVGFGEEGDWTAGGDTFIGRMIETAGGNNIASEVEGWSFSLEKLVERDPDVIIIGEERKAAFENSPLYRELSAVKNNRVFGIDEDIISRQGPRLIEGLEILNKVFLTWNE